MNARCMMLSLLLAIALTIPASGQEMQKPMGGTGMKHDMAGFTFTVK